MTRDRDMLLATLAVQLGFVEAAEVLGCARELLHGAERRTLGAVLRARGLLSKERLELLEAMAAKAVGDVGDPSKTLELLPKERAALVKGLFAAAEAGPRAPDAQRPTVELRLTEAVCVEQAGQYVSSEEPPSRGSDANVVVVHDAFLGREVALTELVSEGGRDPEAVERFYGEARLAAQLEHPAMVPVYELGRRQDGTPYYTMMRVHGETLAVALARAHTLAERLKLVPTLLTVAQCVASAHARRVVHGGLSLDTVVRGNFGEVYVLDWGRAAKRLPSHVEHQEGPDERDDVFHLGAMLYQVLTAQPPGTAPPPVTSLARRAPRELGAICTKALQPDRARRYADADELAFDLRAYLSGRRVAAHRYSPVDLLRRWVQKHRLRVLTVATLAVVSAAGLGLGVSTVRKERDQARRFAEQFLFDVSERLPATPSVAPLVDALSGAALRHYRSSDDLAQASDAQRLEVARAFTRLGELATSLERLDIAQEDLALAISVADGVTQAQPGLAEAHATLARALLSRSELPKESPGANLERLQRAHTHLRTASSLEPRAEWLLLEGAVLLAEGRAVREGGVAGTSAQWFRLASEVAQKVPSTSPHAVDAKRLRAESAIELASLELARGNLGTARDSATQAVALAREGVGTPPHPDDTKLLVRGLLGVVEVALAGGDGNEARRAAEEARLRSLEVLATMPDDGPALGAVMEAQLSLGQASEALRLVREVDVRGDLDAVGAVPVEVAFLAGDFELAASLAKRPVVASSATARLYHALAAAMLDRPAEALTQLDHDNPWADVRWVPGAAQAVANLGPLAPAVRAFAGERDASTRQPDDGARRSAAMAALLHALEARRGGAPDAQH